MDNGTSERPDTDGDAFGASSEDGNCNDLSPPMAGSASNNIDPHFDQLQLDSKNDDDDHTKDTTTAAVPASASLHDNIMKGVLSENMMTTVGSDEWTNFIVIDGNSNNSQESLVNNAYGFDDGDNDDDDEMNSSSSLTSPSSDSPTNVTDFASAAAAEEMDIMDNESLLFLEEPPVKLPATDASQRHVSREVCQLLGLPRCSLGVGSSSHRNNHRVGGIMSSNTELKLRELVQKEVDAIKKTGKDETLLAANIRRPHHPRKEMIAFTADSFPPNNENGVSSVDVPPTSRLGEACIGTQDGIKEEEEEGFDWHENILTEGEYYLAMSMLVYIYSLLREASLLGHTNIAFNEMDCCGDDDREGSHNKFLDKTKSAGFIIRVVMDELERNELLGSVGKNEGDRSFMKEFQRLVTDSRVPQTDAATEETMKQLRRKVAKRRWKRAISAVRLIGRLGKSSMSNSSIQIAVTRDTSTTPNGWPTTDDHQSIKHANSSKSFNSITSTAVKEIACDALEEPKFFKAGSLMSNLIESGIEVVWLGDSHPNDVVYSICCNRQKKRVSVVFRGSVTLHNWIMNMKYSMSEHPNPISEDYPGREGELGLHTGFALYMLRQRKDNDLTKIEEIFSNVDSIGRELAPAGDYELTITGHSLGGALATILSFYAATSNMFSNVKTIQAFTFAAPRVGCQRFVTAFQHLERKGRLRLARFSNTSDIVPLVPFLSKTGRPYKHVGLHIRLNGTSKLSQYWLRQSLDVTYPLHHGLWSQLCRGLRSSLVMNLNTVPGYMRQHSLSKYQRGINFALQYRSALSLTDFFRCKKRNRLKTLDEYYFIKGASIESAHSKHGTLTRIFLEDREKEGYRREARKIVIVLLLVVLAEAAVLLNFFNNTSYTRTSHYDKKYATKNHHLFNFIGLASMKSFATSLYSRRINNTHVFDSTINFSLALPYIRGPRKHSFWGVRLPYHKIPSSLIPSRIGKKEVN